MAPQQTTSTPSRSRILDLAMLLLAVGSVALLVWVTFFETTASTVRTVFVIDTGICGIFAIEFAWRWRQASWNRRFPLRNWYEIIGMIPVAHPALRGFRLLRIVVVLMRFGRTLDRVIGEGFTHRVVSRFSGTIVETLKRPITIAVLDEVSGVLQRGHYTHNTARALQENQHEIRAMVAEKLAEDRHLGRLAALPFYREIVSGVTDTAIRVVLEVLTDPRTDEFVADAVRENLEQIRTHVREEELDETRGQRDAPVSTVDRS
ncbi:MAG: ion transporter [Pseudonocardiaceae bacterium]|nr:ion transporter [Pseudonocardiaceae bacterium]